MISFATVKLNFITTVLKDIEDFIQDSNIIWLIHISIRSLWLVYRIDWMRSITEAVMPFRRQYSISSAWWSDHWLGWYQVKITISGQIWIFILQIETLQFPNGVNVEGSLGWLQGLHHGQLGENWCHLLSLKSR